MVISSNLTVQLENIHVVTSSNRSRSQSVPTFSYKSSKSSPDRARKERKRRVHHQKFIPDKPPFLNFASAYINPYRYLTPIIINHDHHRRHHSKTTKHSKRKQRKNQELSNHSIHEEEKNIEENSLSIEILQNTNPIDLWPSDPNGFDMDFIRQRQIAIDNTFYREIIQTWKPSSLNHLITLIKELITEKNLIDQVWIIFYWISQNILYDIDADIDNRNLKQKPDEIFHVRKTTCDGYATIFKTLCDHIGIKCVIISGYAKDFHFQINQPLFSHTNHMWNAIQLDGNHWYLIDLVLGSGYINNKHEYKQDLKTHYFLIRPEYMIYNHLPKDSQWQYLAKPISMLDFSRLPYLHSYYFTYELTIISPRFSSIVPFDTNESHAEVLIQAPNDVQLTCSIKNDYHSTSLTQYDASRHIWQCLFAPYKSGFYTLIIYANRLLTSNSFNNAIELGVEVSPKEFIRKKKFPITFAKFIEYKCQIFSPLNGILKHGTKLTIHCRIPNASYVRISVDDIWLEEMTVKDEIFKQKITVPGREIIVYAQFNNKKLNNTYYGLIRYLVEK